MAIAVAKNPRTGTAHLVAAWDRPDGITELICFGPKRHYRKAGDCACVAQVLASLAAEARAKVVVVPFGRMEATDGR